MAKKPDAVYNQHLDTVAMLRRHAQDKLGLSRRQAVEYVMERRHNGLSHIGAMAEVEGKFPLG